MFGAHRRFQTLAGRRSYKATSAPYTAQSRARRARRRGAGQTSHQVPKARKLFGKKSAPPEPMPMSQAIQAGLILKANNCCSNSSQVTSLRLGENIWRPGKA